MAAERKVFVLAHDQARRGVGAFALSAPEGWHVTFQPATKKRDQEEKYHAQIGDIARQTTYAGRAWGTEDMKRILVDEFAAEMRSARTPLHADAEGRLIPSEDGRRVIQLGIQTRDFWVREASEFIEWLNAWGAERSVIWANDARHGAGVEG